MLLNVTNKKEFCTFKIEKKKKINKKSECTEVVTCWRSTGLTVGEMATVRVASMFLVSARGWSMARLGMWA